MFLSHFSSYFLNVVRFIKPFVLSKVIDQADALLYIIINMGINKNKKICYIQINQTTNKDQKQHLEYTHTKNSTRFYKVRPV